MLKGVIAMKLVEAENNLRSILPDKYVNSDEYQDKYFLMRKIKKIIPSLSDEIIYSTINKCNNIIAKPRKRDDFIKTFLNQIFPILQ